MSSRTCLVCERSDGGVTADGVCLEGNCFMLLTRWGRESRGLGTRQVWMGSRPVATLSPALVDAWLEAGRPGREAFMADEWISGNRP